MASSVYSRTLRKAAELLGGEAKLCRVLRVPAAELRMWIDDKRVPPIGSFLRAVDIVLSETSAPSGSDAPDALAPRDCISSEGSSTAGFWLVALALAVSVILAAPPSMAQASLGAKLSESAGQPFVVENRPGANGAIGAGL